MDKKAIFFDIDGTLLDFELGVPKSAKEAIRRLREQGHMTFLSTGRTRAFIADRGMADLGFDGILAGCGTYVYYQGEVLLLKELGEQLVEDTLALLRECHMIPVLEGQEYLYFDQEVMAEPDFMIGHCFQEFRNNIKPIQGNERQYRVSKMTVSLHHAVNPERVFERFVGDYGVIRHGEAFVELVPKGCSKRTSMEFLCARLGLSREQVYAFGDGSNDVEMLQFAGCGIAMGNASDQAKEAADYVTASLREDGVYKALEKFGLL